MIVTAPPDSWNYHLVHLLVTLRGLPTRFSDHDKQHAFTNTPLCQPSAVQQPVAAAFIRELG